MSESLEERLRDRIEHEPYGSGLYQECLEALVQLRSERDAYVALYGKEKEWRSAAEVALLEKGTR